MTTTYQGYGCRMTSTGQRKSAPYIPSWPLLPPDEPCVRFCHNLWNIGESTMECVQEETNRLIKLWNEVKEEDKEAYYKEYEDDLKTYWRIQMLICGCPTCKHQINMFQGTIDVTSLISKLNSSYQKNNSSLVLPTSSSHCVLPTHMSSKQDVQPMQTTSSDSGTNPTFENGVHLDQSYDRLSADLSIQDKTQSSSSVEQELISDTSSCPSKRGYPFTTSNCMDFSDEESVSDEVEIVSIPLISVDRSSPNLLSLVNPPELQKIVDCSAESALDLLSTSKNTSTTPKGKFSPHNHLLLATTNTNSQPFSLFSESSNCPSDFSLSSKSELCESANQKNLAFLEIKGICIEMILKKLKYYKYGTEEEVVEQIDASQSEINIPPSSSPEFEPINKTLRQHTWELFIENESRKEYNRKVTLKLKWNSKGGEPIIGMDGNGAKLNFHYMQPFVRLVPLKCVKTPITLTNTTNNILPRRRLKQRLNSVPRRRTQNSLKLHLFNRSKENFKVKQRNKNQPTMDNPVVCNVCNLGFAKTQALIIHRLSCNEISVKKSVNSVFEYLSLKGPLDNLYTTATNKPHQCSKCTASFTDQILREIHMYIAHRNNRWTCSICGENFSNDNSYFLHVMDHQKHQCMICKNMFETIEELNSHLVASHLEWSLCCQKCDIVLPSLVTYQSHMLEHLTIRPFSCSVCPKRFKRKYHLVEHLWLHRTQGFKCGHCTLSFSRRRVAIAHKRKVHGLYSRTVCEQRNDTVKQ